MIQRIQTVYLAIAIILLSIVTFGVEIVSFTNDTSRFTFSSYGITEYPIDSETVVSHHTFPIFISTIGLIMLCFICIMSYKNLKRQYKLGRTIFGLYFLFVVGIILLTIMGDKLIGTETSAREMGVGFILFVAGFPFTFLANTGIKRDKRLLSSLDRLR
ncbi:MAG: DUF4293 domain-containing protein [Crocinitomicaceae bacterium]|nr:DUF4293 domain-containing protein [Crocinitomicaceae bacterium]